MQEISNGEILFSIAFVVVALILVFATPVLNEWRKQMNDEGKKSLF